MFHDFSFEDVLATSQRAAWQLDDVLPPGSSLDLLANFMPDGLACTARVATLSLPERRTLNQIRGHEYLSIFGIVEEFILPFLMDHARAQLSGDDTRTRALLQFAGEEAKHIHLFKRFHTLFTDSFGVRCDVVGPGEAIAAEVLRHDPLSVALLILQIEWMTQSHYLDSVKDDGALDPLFKSLLRHHWIEESQHAKLDTLIVEELASDRSEEDVQTAIDGYFEIIAFLDNGFRLQAGLNARAFFRPLRTRGASESNSRRRH